jgi:hypothetical protein
MSNNVHPYWGKAKQQQAKQTQPKQRQPARQRDGFDDEWKDRDVEVEQVKGQGVVVMRGRVVDVSKYWLKIIVNGEVVYLNKAYIASIKPAVIKNAGGGSNAGAGQSRAG